MAMQSQTQYLTTQAPRLSLQDQASLAEQIDGPSRRRFAVFATAFIGGVSALLAGGSAKAYADALGSPCCHLATGTWCYYAVNRNRWNCNGHPGTNRVFWTCTANNRIVYCGECTTGDNCYMGSWKCSIWFYG